ncbi:structural maintenance of chromosomes protein 4-like isoform X1 [Chenopodium quinoa]|uniref:structural maintenance of chromosomes protein 4-like isoform X1 n=1 Tax=Chenopodium quinoa TaxID=63459 RepID=UPI000B7830A2|nr:structural maintenance of chromosomes protein 4-like isoform X1 [Chenopodium quinoa]XP_021736364.1 structural maintenance of chromosomes protein 4-like isoform X1 [Chenopodium quinoa]XP_021736365.1 structural maintenance of chromosomes protein 4-like isoform X1 [Chenopodium quinoa]XP_021736366.1 structural maintenance of chromosomes protein 4-like isoform X1 [Chenopodium quinoa]XP_021736367.1 structural maintenance of chromosomes protein 4-like isoform X1 [Chenopodium quinoa]XP_021736368.1 
MVKLAEKERDSLEDVKNEAESFMLKELSLFKWQERATKLAAEDNNAKMAELQNNLSSLEESLKLKREEIQGNKSTLKELETLHNKYLKRQEELDNDLRSCKEEFKEFERQDVQYREDYKHMKQKIKKLEDKIEKDSSKINDFTKDCENATQAIPKLEEDIPKLQKRLVEEEKVLEEIKEKSKGETEIHRSELAKMITLGGDAELELVDSLDPFSEGVVFSVRPPKKSWKNIANLSGGEKTLSSLALIFALHHYKPTPLYVMDEIDAALVECFAFGEGVSELGVSAVKNMHQGYPTDHI